MAARYDVGLLDLDGVVYRLTEAIDGAPEAIAEARALGMRMKFVTNNASRRATEVARLLGELGVSAAASDVVTSAQAAAELLARRLPPGSAVLVVGAAALADELVDVGLKPVWSADDEPAAVVQGYSPDLDWRALAEGALAIGRGTWWVATNTDRTLPSPRGPLPGNGALVAAVATAVGRNPDVVVGKPYPELHQSSVRRSEARHPLIVGDRLDTDIEAAVAAGTDSLLVLTGVARPADLLAASPPCRPTFVAADLRGLVEPHPELRWADGAARCGMWSARRESDVVTLAGAGAGAGAGADIEALRAICVATWRGAGGVSRVAGDDASAREAIARLGLT